MRERFFSTFLWEPEPRSSDAYLFMPPFSPHPGHVGDLAGNSHMHVMTCQI